MKPSFKTSIARIPARRALALAAAIMLAGCAAQMEHSKGLSYLNEGEPVKGIESLRRATELEPMNTSYKFDFIKQKSLIVSNLLDRADAKREAGSVDLATQLYQQVISIESHNDRALAGIRLLDAEARSGSQLQQADQFLLSNKPEAALELANRVLRELPQNVRAAQLRRDAEGRIESTRQQREETLAARAAFRRPVTLSFKDTPLKMVFEALSKSANVNVVLDRDIKSDVRTTIFVKNAAIEDAIDVILLQNQLEKRLLNGNTILIYPATAAKQKELAELKVRTFHLSNIDAGLMANIIKSMVHTKDIVTDTRSNMLVMRDTPEAVALAERLIAANDLPDPEVMLEVHVLEISSSRSSEIGLKLPSTLTVGTPSSALTVGDFRALRGNDLTVSGLSATLNLMLSDSDTNILANPRIRTRNKEKARILVGDKLPQITNLISPQQQGASSVITGSIQYVDVGIKLDVEPEVYADSDVGIKLNLEVSTVSDTITTQSGRAYQIGTRSAQTSLRLRDGETQVMAGLINDSDRKSASRVPGLGELPVLGRLFSSRGGDAKKTEIVLAITPHIIRPHVQPDLRYSDAWSGTDSAIRDRELRIDTIGALKVEVPKTGAAPAVPVLAPPVAPAPRPVVVDTQAPVGDAPAVSPQALLAPPTGGVAPAAAAVPVPVPPAQDSRPRPLARPIPGKAPMAAAPADAPADPAVPADKP